MGFFEDILSIPGNLLGINQNNDAKKAQKNATTYNTQAATGYQNLQNIGSGIQTPQDQGILSLIQQFGQNAGIQTGLPQQQQPGGVPGTNQVTVGGIPQGQPAGQVQPGGAPQTPQQQGLQQGPYALNQVQSQQLNQMTDRINVQKRQDLAAVTEQLNKQGLASSPQQVAEITQMVNEHYDALQTTTTTDFYDKIAKEKEQALSSLISTLTGLYGQGTAGLASLGGAQQQTALQQQQLSNNQLGGVLSLAGLFAGGGFNSGGGGTPFTASDYSNELSQHGITANDLYTG